MNGRDKTRCPRLAMYGISHLIVDMCCFYILYAGVMPFASSDPARYRGYAAVCFVLYNCAAFGLQVVFGRMADRRGGHRLMAAAGCALLTAAVMLLDSGGAYRAVFCAMLAAIGNALFHTGGGVDTLLSAGGKMTPNGLFVAPGAIGVALGRYIGKLYPFPANGCPVGARETKLAMLGASTIALAMCAAVFFFKRGEETARFEEYRFADNKKSAAFIVTAAIAVVILRALVGSYMPISDSPIGKDLGDMLPVVFAACAALGKALGGISGDAFGARRVSVISLSAAAVLLVYGIWFPGAAPLAVMLFNFTMPITLCVCASVMPGRYGEAFGLTTLGLLIGSLPEYLLKLSYYPRLCLSLPLIAVSALLLYRCCAQKQGAEHEHDVQGDT